MKDIDGHKISAKNEASLRAISNKIVNAVTKEERETVIHLLGISDHYWDFWLQHNPTLPLFNMYHAIQKGDTGDSGGSGIQDLYK